MASLALEAMTPRDRWRRGCAGKTDPGAARESSASEVAREEGCGRTEAPARREERNLSKPGARITQDVDVESSRHNYISCRRASTRGTRAMAPAKVTDAFQATKRGRGVVKGKPKAKPARAAGAYPFVRLVRSAGCVERKFPPLSPTETIG